jgi:2'-phosphotransferase
MSRRDRRGGGGSQGLPRGVQVSKKLSWLLRHGAEKEGLKLGPGGYINVSEVVGLNLEFLPESNISRLA